LVQARTFELLACALAGREVKVAEAGPNEPCWTDGTRIFVDPGLPADERLRAVAVQACLMAGGSLDPYVLRRLGRRSGIARRYLTVEGHRVLYASAHLLPPALYPMLDTATAGLSTTPAESLKVASGNSPIPELPPYFGTLHARKVLAANRSAESAQAMHRGDSRPELKDLDDDGEDPSDVEDPFTSPVNAGGAVGKLLQRLLRAGRKSGGGGNPGAENATHRSRAGGRPGTGVYASAAALADDDRGAFAPSNWTYPEWDNTARRYRADWCTVNETDPAPGESPLVVADRHSLRRPLTRLGIALDRAHRQAQGDDIDIDAVVEARVEIRAGSPPDERVYVDSLPRRRDLAVLVLLDVSGSAAEAGTLGQTVHEQQRIAAATLTVALHELGDRVALYAYHSQGRSSVSLLPVKRFDEPLDSTTLTRLDGLRPGGYSRLGAAIRHGTAVIGDRGATSHRLLVVVSDGLAYDHGYERAYGAADAHRALSEARRQGIGCLCLTVGAATDDNDLRRVFGSAAYAAIPRPAQLGDVVGPLFRSALRSADTRRKVA
jgi:hypothetical protein